MMTDRQKKTLKDALVVLSAGAARGKRLIDDGATLTEMKQHIGALVGLALEMQRGVDMAMGADAVLERAGAPRAKVLPMGMLRRRLPS